MTEKIHLKWYHTFVFLFQATLSVADVVTDALTCASYLRQEKIARFCIGLALIILPLFVTCIWSVVASTYRTLDRDSEEMSRQEPFSGKVDVFFRSIPLNICLSCWCFGPTLHSLELFLYCARNFRTLWMTKGGKEVTKDDGCLYYLYIHNMNMKLVEGLLESGPQLLLQLYVMVLQTTGHETTEVETIQVVSVSISFLCLTYTITSDEVLKEHSGRGVKLWQTMLIFGSNVGLMAGRAGAIVFFVVTLDWWLSLVVFVHWLIVILMGLALWNSERIQHIVKFCFCHSLPYIFVFRSSSFRNIRSGNKPMSKVTEYLTTIVWYFFFAAENSAMILAYYMLEMKEYRKIQLERCLDVPVVAVVLGGTFGGMIVKSLLCFCFKQRVPEDEDVAGTRAFTIIVRDQGVRVRNVLDDNVPTLQRPQVCQDEPEKHVL